MRIPFKVLLLKEIPINAILPSLSLFHLVYWSRNDIATLCWVPRVCDEPSKSFSICRTFTAPATVTQHKINLNKFVKERNLHVSKLKQFLVCKCLQLFVCSK